MVLKWRLQNFSSYSIRPTGPDGRAGPLRYSCMSFDVLLRVLAVDDNSCIHVIGHKDLDTNLTRNQGIRPYVEFSQAISYLSSNTLFNLHGSPNFLYAFPHAQPPRWLHKRTA